MLRGRWGGGKRTVGVQKKKDDLKGEKEGR